MHSTYMSPPPPRPPAASVNTILLPPSPPLLPPHALPAADSNAPTWWNNLDGQVNLRDAVNRSISVRTPQKEYRWVMNSRQAAALHQTHRCTRLHMFCVPVQVVSSVPRVEQSCGTLPMQWSAVLLEQRTIQ
jgi:hypothetical protein